MSGRSRREAPRQAEARPVPWEASTSQETGETGGGEGERQGWQQVQG